MSLKPYSPELLRMVYLFAISEKRLFGKELENHLISGLDIESPRTVYRWLKKIKSLNDGEQTFDYYPSLKITSFGLIKYEVIFKNPKNLRIINAIPHTYWAGLFLDRDFNRILIMHFLIPPENFDEFELVLKSYQQNNFFDEFTIFALSNGYYVPSPFHEMVDEEGKFKSNVIVDNSTRINKIIIKEEPAKINDKLINEPILIPILLESDKESSPYETVFYEVKKKLGLKIKGYFQNGYNRFPDNPESGGKYVQKVLQNANDNFNDFYDHMRVYYKPLYEVSGVQSFNFSLDLNSKQISDVRSIISIISNASIFMSYYIAKDRFGSMAIRGNVNTSLENFMKVMTLLKNDSFNLEYYTLDRKVSWYLWNRQVSKFNYWDLFDPNEKKWLFNFEKYTDNL